MRRYAYFLRSAAARVACAACLTVLPLTAAAMNVQPDVLFVVDDTPVYNKPDGSGQPVGVVGALQTVKVAGALKPLDDEVSPSDQWFQIETWLGNKWVKEDGRVINGIYRDEDKTITTVFETAVFDMPNPQAVTDVRLAPQPLHATGSVSYGPLHFSNVMSANAQSGIWYRIDTKLGVKWIVSPKLLEDVHEKPVSYDMKLTGKETVYPHPFIVESVGEPIEPQIVRVTGEWDQGTGPWGAVWYRVQLAEGERWVAPEHPVLQNFREVKEPLALATETRYFTKPVDDLSDHWLSPGTYEAFEASGDWTHIRTPQGEVWVNPKRALLERPEGIVKTEEQIGLTKETETFRFPSTEEPLHLKGFYAPQTVQAYEKWVSGSGVTWYHFHSFIDEWVQIP